MISVQSSNLAELSEALGRRKSHIEAAMRKACASFAALMRSEVLSAVRKKTGLPRSEMNRFRIRAKIVRNKLEASLWVGANAVSVRYLSPRFTSTGVKAAGNDYARAFLPRKKKGSSLILQRVGKERLPVIAPEVDINEIVIDAIEALWPRFEAYFHKRVEAELLKID